MPAQRRAGFVSFIEISFGKMCGVLEEQELAVECPDRKNFNVQKNVKNI